MEMAAHAAAGRAIVGAEATPSLFGSVGWSTESL